MDKKGRFRHYDQIAAQARLNVIEKVSPKAARLGITSEELFAAIAALGKHGYETTKAVKMINTAIEKAARWKYLN
jgi:hypothetical protein